MNVPRLSVQTLERNVQRSGISTGSEIQVMIKLINLASSAGLFGGK